MKQKLYAIQYSILTMGVESVVESLVSTWESKFHKNGNCKEENALLEMELCVNGPVLAECDSVVREALRRHFVKNKKKSGLHFLTSDLTKTSKVMSRIGREKSKFPFVNQD